MRRSIGIAAVVLVSAAAVWAWALNHSGAKAPDRVSSGINTLSLTMNASVLPVQRYDAH
jgi:hypothetical protein